MPEIAWRIVTTTRNDIQIGVDGNAGWWAKFPPAMLRGSQLHEIASMTVEVRMHEPALVTGLVLTGKTARG